MLESIISYLDSGVRKIRDNPQLIYSIGIAAVIIAAFVFMASRFIGIATDAQERLINVRVGSLQDAFVSFAAEHVGDTAYLNARISQLMAENETIKNFRVVQKQEVFTDATSSAYIVIASNVPKEIGRADTEDEFLFSLASGDPDHSITTQLNTGGGRLFDTARAIIDQSGGVLGIVMTTQTLSAADKAIQDNITDSVYMLAFVICVIMFLFFRHARIIDYMDLYRRLKEVDTLKDDFISMASHELRTPLTIIRGYADFLRDAPELSPESKEFVTKIELGSKNLEGLVADMLDVSRIEQGRMTFAMERFNPREIVASVTASFSVVAKEKGLEIAFDDAGVDETQTIYADKERLRQVLVNIIGNAVKYTKQGSVHVSQYAEGDRVAIRVRDTGIGISAEARERLFQKFYRIRTKETETITGTGLGLWITAQIVKEMRGVISVESIEGVGSHFIISFPVSQTQ